MKIRMWCRRRSNPTVSGKEAGAMMALPTVTAHAPGDDTAGDREAIVHRHSGRTRQTASSTSSARTQFVKPCRISCSTSPQSFADTVDNLPHFYKQELLRCPPHLRVDSAGMSKAEAINNNAELNRLRRERCLPLATPQTAKFYAQESFQVLMVSGVVKRRFWQLWRLVDLTTSSESIWKATCRFLTNNPHKPVVRPSTRKHADMDEDDLQSEADEPNGPPSSPIPKRATSGRMALEALSAPSPDAQASAQPGANLSTDQVQKWAAERIQADIRSMDVNDLMLTTGRKWPNTISIERAVEALPHADALGAVFKLSFAAYKKAFTKAFANLDLSKRGILAQLRAQIKELNLEMDRKSDPKQLSEVLAWAKASALLRAD
ncbi:unnamed protein product [Polarella glacialis]|uniref:Uncharacterized protein n=1 Tax=Polarella glacialis TaxID=89957 RepID=A0A813E899_POLGL|nr:unnamed protein product [Polarella glacialis]